METKRRLPRNEIHLQMGTNERTTETNNYQRKYSQDFFRILKENLKKVTPTIKKMLDEKR